MVVALRDTAEFKRGRNAERLVAEELMSIGYFINPSYDYDGGDDHPPRLICGKKKFVIPDLDASRWRDRRWAEVKSKAKPTHYRKTDTDEHGTSCRLFYHYQQVERITGTPVWMFIYEENSKLILYRRLELLGAGRVYDGPKAPEPGGWVLWPRALFRIWKREWRDD